MTNVSTGLAGLHQGRWIALLILGYFSVNHDSWGGPDLVIDRARLGVGVEVQTAAFPATSCAVVEGCVNASGSRQIVRFTVGIANIGDADLVLGKPADHPELYVYSDCHGHYHLKDVALYELISSGGTVVASSGKRAFCLRDNVRYTAGAGPARGYHCDYQGISAGWADIYPKSLDCQWLDITGVTPGNYTLRVTVNPEGKLPEGNYHNNSATVPVNVGVPGNGLPCCKGPPGKHKDCKRVPHKKWKKGKKGKGHGKKDDHHHNPGPGKGEPPNNKPKGDEPGKPNPEPKDDKPKGPDDGKNPDDGKGPDDGKDPNCSKGPFCKDTGCPQHGGKDKGCWKGPFCKDQWCKDHGKWSGCPKGPFCKGKWCGHHGGDDDDDGKGRDDDDDGKGCPKGPSCKDKWCGHHGDDDDDGKGHGDDDDDGKGRGDDDDDGRGGDDDDDGKGGHKCSKGPGCKGDYCGKGKKKSGWGGDDDD